MTAAVGLYAKLGLPQPWSPTLTPTPLIVYGGSGSVVCAFLEVFVFALSNDTRELSLSNLHKHLIFVSSTL